MCVGKRGLATGLTSNLFICACRCENVKQMIQQWDPKLMGVNGSEARFCTMSLLNRKKEVGAISFIRFIQRGY